MKHLRCEHNVLPGASRRTQTSWVIGPAAECQEAVECVCVCVITFRGLELRKLSLPEAQDISRQAAEPGHLSDAKVQLVGDQHFLRTGSGGCVLSLYSWTGRGGSSGTQLKSLYFFPGIGRSGLWRMLRESMRTGQARKEYAAPELPHTKRKSSTRSEGERIQKQLPM